MTKQEMLAEVEAKIREDIPRLMELNVGCKLWFSDSHNSSLIKIIAEDKEEDCFYVLEDSYDVDKYKKSFINEHYQIIGHDIMLNDVLEWLLFNAFSVEFQENGDFNKYRYSDNNLVFDRFDFASWYLPSPYLKDQSEELIKFLYNLIKE